jgi:predicted transcriptional regulator
VRDLPQAKVAQIHSKVEELHLLEEQLTKKLRKCEHKLKTSGDAHNGRWPVLDEIARRGSHEN